MDDTNVGRMMGTEVQPLWGRETQKNCSHLRHHLRHVPAGRRWLVGFFFRGLDDHVPDENQTRPRLTLLPSRSLSLSFLPLPSRTLVS